MVALRSDWQLNDRIPLAKPLSVDCQQIYRAIAWAGKNMVANLEKSSKFNFPFPAGPKRCRVKVLYLASSIWWVHNQENNYIFTDLGALIGIANRVLWYDMRNLSGEFIKKVEQMIIPLKIQRHPAIRSRFDQTFETPLISLFGDLHGKIFTR